MLTTAALRFASIATVLLAATATNAQTTYRWIDRATGGTVVSDRPPPPGARQVVVVEAASGPDRQRLPYATRQASEKFPVVLYTSADCPACPQARALLNGRGVPFAEKLLTSEEQLAELGRQLGGAASLPSISVGRQGSRAFAAATWNELLDLAGYPATAPYGYQPSGSAAE